MEKFAYDFPAILWVFLSFLFFAFILLKVL